MSIQGTASGTSVSKYGTTTYFIYLFLLQLATLSTAENIAHQKAGRLMNNELERMCKEVVVAYLRYCTGI